MQRERSTTRKARLRAKYQLACQGASSEGKGEAAEEDGFFHRHLAAVELPTKRRRVGQQLVGVIALKDFLVETELR